MRDLEKYRGVFPAFYACYDEAGEISPKRVRELTRYFIRKGVKGVYVNGSSGECIYQSVEDRKTVLENVMEAAEGRLTVIAHVACNNTRDSEALARHAESLRVDAVAAIPPIYFHLPEYAIARYWNDISAAAPNTDFVIYNIPQLAGVTLTLPLFREMRKNPRVIKEILRINEDLDIGGVRPPLPELTESDGPIVQEAAAMIRRAREEALA